MREVANGLRGVRAGGSDYSFKSGGAQVMQEEKFQHLFLRSILYVKSAEMIYTTSLYPYPHTVKMLR
jgi:hypothetical protein